VVFGVCDTERQTSAKSWSGGNNQTRLINPLSLQQVGHTMSEVLWSDAMISVFRFIQERAKLRSLCRFETVMITADMSFITIHSIYERPYLIPVQSLLVLFLTQKYNSILASWYWNCGSSIFDNCQIAFNASDSFPSPERKLSLDLRSTLLTIYPHIVPTTFFHRLSSHCTPFSHVTSTASPSSKSPNNCYS
jgi:hypothetical protein